MDKRTATGRRRTPPAEASILGQVQAGLLLGFGIVVLLIVFGAGVLVGMWYQANEHTTSYAEVTPSTGQAADPEHATGADEQQITFYSTLRAHEPVPPTLTAPSTPPGKPAIPQVATPPAPAASTPPATSPSTPATAQRPTQTASREPAPTPPSYSVQVGSFRAADEAEKLRKELAHKGYQAHIRLFMLPGQGPWYRVRVGSYTERVAAEKAARQFRTHERLPAIVAVEAQSP